MFDSSCFSVELCQNSDCLKPSMYGNGWEGCLCLFLSMGLLLSYPQSYWCLDTGRYADVWALLLYGVSAVKSNQIILHVSWPHGEDPLGPLPSERTQFSWKFFFTPEAFHWTSQFTIVLFHLPTGGKRSAPTPLFQDPPRKQDRPSANYQGFHHSSPCEFSPQEESVQYPLSDSLSSAFSYFIFILASLLTQRNFYLVSSGQKIYSSHMLFQLFCLTSGSQILKLISKELAFYFCSLQ